MYDVVALGELLIDFSPKKLSTPGNTVFEANPGGAPCNVLAMLSRLGKKTAFIGKVGQDMFGKQLVDTIKQLGIDTKGVVCSTKYRTTLAFVSIDEQGERDFSFYRNPGADMMLNTQEVDVNMIKEASIFHFGTISMTHDGVKEATVAAIAYAKANKVLISFDPNLRPPLWEDIQEAKKQMRYGCSMCDILKIEDEELFFMSDTTTIEDGVAFLKEQYTIGLILVTRGAKGSIAYANGMCVTQPAFLTKETKDTTGAGDTFFGMCLAYVLDHPVSTLTTSQLHDMLMNASLAASLVTTRRGALQVMPSPEEVEAYKKQMMK